MVDRTVGEGVGIHSRQNRQRRDKGQRMERRTERGCNIQQNEDERTRNEEVMRKEQRAGRKESGWSRREERLHALRDEMHAEVASRANGEGRLKTKHGRFEKDTHRGGGAVGRGLAATGQNEPAAPQHAARQHDAAAAGPNRHFPHRSSGNVAVQHGREPVVCGNGVEPREASSRRRSHLTPHAARHQSADEVGRQATTANAVSEATRGPWPHAKDTKTNK